jgi:hypothetical protein
VTRDERLRQIKSDWINGLTWEQFIDLKIDDIFMAGATAQLTLDLEAQAPAETGTPYVGPDLGGEG